MLSVNIPGNGQTHLGYDVELSGGTLTVWPIHRTIGVGAEKVRIRDPKMSWEAGWDFETNSIPVSELKFPTNLIPFLEKHFGGLLKKLEPERQEPLFKEGCTVCGAKEVAHPVDVHDGFGNPLAPPTIEKVRWLCAVCDRLICRSCVVTVEGRGQEIWHNTYCSQACRAAAPVDMLDEDEQNRMT